jgi:hypothetical protein
MRAAAAFWAARLIAPKASAASFGAAAGLGTFCLLVDVVVEGVDVFLIAVSAVFFATALAGFFAVFFRAFLAVLLAVFFAVFLTVFLAVFLAFTPRDFLAAAFLAPDFLAPDLAARFVAFLAFFFFADFLATAKSSNDQVERDCDVMIPDA